MKIIKNTTCFKEHATCKVNCRKKSCRHWIKSKMYLNCSIIAANDGPMTLQKIGDLYGLTRMRICQIEKSAIKKIKALIKK